MKAEDNESVRQGLWGEDAAVRDLKRRGCSIVGRRVRPSAHDRRLEIDVIAKDPEDTLLFVEVKTHKERSPYGGALPRIDAAKKANLRRACLSWLRSHRWSGNYRFAVYQIYGDSASGAAPEIDFFPDVRLFPPRFRFL